MLLYPATIIDDEEFVDILRWDNNEGYDEEVDNFSTVDEEAVDDDIQSSQQAEVEECDCWIFWEDWWWSAGVNPLYPGWRIWWVGFQGLEKRLLFCWLFCWDVNILLAVEQDVDDDDEVVDEQVLFLDEDEK